MATRDGSSCPRALRQAASRGAQCLPEIRIVLLGQGLIGKSSSGNTILGREEFGTGDGAGQCVRRQGHVAGRQVSVVDTPGWAWNTAVISEQEKEQVERSVTLCPPGPHALLLVTPVSSSFTEAERRSVEKHLELLGDRVWRHAMVLFTWADDLGDTDIEQHIERGGKDLQWLVEKCGNRYHVLNNKNRGDRTQVTELLEKIEDMVAGHYGLYFNTDIEQLYTELETCNKTRFEKRQREIEEERRRETEELRQSFEETQREIEELRHKYKEREREREEEISQRFEQEWSRRGEELKEEELRQRFEQERHRETQELRQRFQETQKKVVVLRQKYERRERRREEELRHRLEKSQRETEELRQRFVESQRETEELRQREEEIQREKEELKLKFEKILQREAEEFRQRLEEEWSRREEELKEKMRKTLEEEELEKETEESRLPVKRRNSKDFMPPAMAAGACPDTGSQSRDPSASQ